MNKKLIATAVAGTLIAPAAMAAEDSNVDVYFRIANALAIQDTDGADTTADIANVSSRFGIKGTADLGNGLTAFGRYEFATFTDHEGNVALAGTPNQHKGRGGINDTRLGFVGIKGSFGRISVGNQWSAFYNKVGTYIDPTYTLGYVIYSSQGGGTYRESNAVTYSNSFGPVSLQVDTRFSTDSAASGADVEKIGGDNGENFMDGWGIAGSFAATDMITLSAAYDNEMFAVGDDVTRVGVGAKLAMAGFWVKGGYMTIEQDPATDTDTVGIYAGTQLAGTNVYIGYQQADKDSGNTPKAFVLHADYKIGGGPLKLFYEGLFADMDGVRADFNTHLLGLRIDLST